MIIMFTICKYRLLRVTNNRELQIPIHLVSKKIEVQVSDTIEFFLHTLSVSKLSSVYAAEYAPRYLTYAI